MQTEFSEIVLRRRAFRKSAQPIEGRVERAALKLGSPATQTFAWITRSNPAVRGLRQERTRRGARPTQTRGVRNATQCPNRISILSCSGFRPFLNSTRLIGRANSHAARDRSRGEVQDFSALLRRFAQLRVIAGKIPQLRRRVRLQLHVRRQFLQLSRGFSISAH
jgi:hypothetical protein